MSQDEYKLSTVAEEKASLGTPQTEAVDPGVIKLPKPKVKKKKKLQIIIGDPEDVNPGETSVQEQTIKLGGASKRGGTEGATIGGRKFKYRRLDPGITSTGGGRNPQR